MALMRTHFLDKPICHFNNCTKKKLILPLCLRCVISFSNTANTHGVTNTSHVPKPHPHSSRLKLQIYPEKSSRHAHHIPAQTPSSKPTQLYTHTYHQQRRAKPAQINVRQNVILELVVVEIPVNPGGAINNALAHPTRYLSPTPSDLGTRAASAFSRSLVSRLHAHHVYARVFKAQKCVDLWDTVAPLKRSIEAIYARIVARPYRPPVSLSSVQLAQLPAREIISPFLELFASSLLVQRACDVWYIGKVHVVDRYIFWTIGEEVLFFFLVFLE